MPFPRACNQTIPRDVVSMDTLREGQLGWDPKEHKLQAWPYSVTGKQALSLASCKPGIKSQLHYVQGCVSLGKLLNLSASVFLSTRKEQGFLSSRVLKGIKQTMHLKH